MAQHEFILMHIAWRKDLMEDHPDCSHILIHNTDRNWRTTSKKITLVTDPEGKVREKDAEYRNPITGNKLTYSEARILDYIFGPGDPQFRIKNLRTDSPYHKYLH